MKTLFYTMGSGDDRAVLRSAGELIRNGQLVCFPTETVYGLGCNALDGTSALKVFTAKGRPADNPLIVHVAYPEEAEKYAETSPLYHALAQAFMPGPLTVILPKKSIVPDEVTAGNRTVAIRCPSHPVAHELILAAGVPIAAPSANRSGLPSPTNAEDVREDMDGRVDMILDGGDCSFGLESTVVALKEDEIQILRPGAVTREMLMPFASCVSVAEAVLDPSRVKDGAVPSPGMKYKHYAPKAKVILVDAERDGFIGYVQREALEGDAVLCYSEDRILFPSVILPIDIGSAMHPEEECHDLFTALRWADKKKARRVFVLKPSVEGVNLALYNRLIRAASCQLTQIK